jgi:GNAT superfamily N-acetyltransferase
MRDPLVNLFALSWLDRHGPLGASHPDDHVVMLAEGPVSPTGAPSLIGACLLLGQRMALPVGPAATGRAFGQKLRVRGIELDHIVGPRTAVTSLWSSYGGGRKPRLDQLQRYLMLDRKRAAHEGSSRVRKASFADLDLLVPAARAMYQEETLVDPCRDGPTAFRKTQERRVREGRTYVWTQGRFLLFKADISCWVPGCGAQLAGVYTPPFQRRRGIARKALKDICHEILGEVPAITLYVNQDNLAALRLYERLGFRDHTQWQTIFVS